MDTDGKGGNAPSASEEAEHGDGERETDLLVKTGPRAGDRAGGMAFLALMVVLAGALHFYLTGEGSDSFINRLDAELLTHAEFSLASMENGGRLTVVPSWPLRLYASLRRDVAVYAVMLAVATYLWGLSARARARRDAFLVHDKLTAEVNELRERIARLDGGPASGSPHGRDERKG